MSRLKDTEPGCFKFFEVGTKLTRRWAICDKKLNCRCQDI